ncbi:MAG: DUF4097 family beta strand repeat-containing protein [Chloroflexota bacterium]
MPRMTYKTQGDTSLSISVCQGDLTVRGWSQDTLQLQSDDENMNITRDGDQFSLSCASDLAIRVPLSSSLEISGAERDVNLRNYHGTTTIGSVGGDLVATKIGALQVDAVQRDVTARYINGSMTIGSVQGDVRIRDVTGKVKVDSVQRDLAARDVPAGLEALQVQGDIRLRTDIAPKSVFDINANLDINARIPRDTDAVFNLKSLRGELRVNAPMEITESSDQHMEGQMGENWAQVSMQAGLDLRLTAVDGDSSEIPYIGAEMDLELAGLADEISAQVESQMNVLSQQLDERLSKMAHLDERAAKVTLKAQREVQRAKERVRRAAERQARKARKKASWRRTRTIIPPVAPPPPVPPHAEPVSDDERMVILNMVADGKISVEEAEKLLAALDT